MPDPEMLTEAQKNELRKIARAMLESIADLCLSCDHRRVTRDHVVAELRRLHGNISASLLLVNSPLQYWSASRAAQQTAIDEVAFADDPATGD